MTAIAVKQVAQVRWELGRAPVGSAGGVAGMRPGPLMKATLAQRKHIGRRVRYHDCFESCVSRATVYRVVAEPDDVS
jgi:hypothetical protein